MLIDKNIQKILGGGYNISEVKYMDKTVWSDGKNITLEIDSDSRISLNIGRQNYSSGTYPLKLANDEDLKVLISGYVPGTKLQREGDVVYHRVHYIGVSIKSSNGLTIGSYWSEKNFFIDDHYVYEECTAPFTKFKNGDKLFIMAEIKYYLKEI